MLNKEKETIREIEEEEPEEPEFIRECGTDDYPECEPEEENEEIEPDIINCYE